jgi:MoxR-like ATPase
VLADHRAGEPVDTLRPVLSHEELLQLQRAVREVRVDDAIGDYLLDVVAATRQHDELQLGVSTRGAITLHRAVQALALVEQRDFVVPDDVKRMAVPVLAHRVVVRGLLREGERDRAQRIVRQIVAQTPVPQ